MSIPNESQSRVITSECKKKPTNEKYNDESHQFLRKPLPVIVATKHIKHKLSKATTQTMRIQALVLSGALALASVSAFVPSPSAPKHVPSLLATTSDDVISPNAAIKVAAQGMTLLKPIFQLEAELQAAALGALAKVDKDEVAKEVADIVKANKIVIYTYALSPFSTEAISILDSTGYDYKNIELGLEWFTLGGKESQTRVALSKQVDNGATSLPKIFIGGKCIGGYAELAALVESGELEAVLKKAGAKKKGEKAGVFAGLPFMK
jgi:glutaredoxin-related protein